MASEQGLGAVGQAVDGPAAGAAAAQDGTTTSDADVLSQMDSGGVASPEDLAYALRILADTLQK